MNTEHLSTSLASDLRSVFLDLHVNPYPHVPNPPDCKKRASVACIVRIRPTYPDIPEYSFLGPSQSNNTNASTDAFSARLDAFFAQPWVQKGEPEILFIKRAANKRDRFSSHIAFPGGRRDPGDEDDRATAVRETLEEVGLDLETEHTLSVGNLPERIVTAEWGKVPLMVLCPFVFLLTRFDIPPLQVQPTEVHSAHWVPLRALLSPSLRTWERSDLSDRLSKSPRGWVARVALRLLLGQIKYAATRLVPSESVFRTSVPDFIPPINPSATIAKTVQLLSRLTLSDHATSADPNRPLLLWGLTHGMVEDLMDLLPSYDIVQAWWWPTFSAPDVMFVTWLMSMKFRKEEVEAIRPLKRDPPSAIDTGLGTVDPGERQPAPARNEETELAPHLAKADAVGMMLRGYFQIIRRAVYITLLGRLGFGVLLALLVRRRRIVMAKRRLR